MINVNYENCNLTSKINDPLLIFSDKELEEINRYINSNILKYINWSSFSSSILNNFSHMSDYQLQKIVYLIAKYMDEMQKIKIPVQ